MSSACGSIEIEPVHIESNFDLLKLSEIQNLFVSYSSPSATPKFSGKNGQEIADTLKATLTSAYTQECLPLELLSIQSGKQCWILHTDLLVSVSIKIKLASFVLICIFK